MDIYKCYERSDKEIVFTSTEDLMNFFESINAGKWVVLEYSKDKIRHGELISPDIAAEIKDFQITVRSEEKK